MRQIRIGSPELRAAIAAARSAQNLKTRKSNEREERIAESARRRRKRISDREAEAFMRRRVRVRAAPEDRYRGSNRTPRKLTNRSIKEVYAGTWGANSQRGADGLSSIHFDFVPRGFASKKGRFWRAGEAERASLYITAHESLEDGELGWHSNVADDRNELRNFWRVLEAAERHDRANANVYVAEIIELPCEASPRLRRRMVRRIATRLERRGLAYVAAIHKPDRGGDQRNFHLHLMYSLRPSERIAAHEWEFGISKVSDINTADGIRERRRCVVRDINATLHAAHIGKRYTALSNGARGLEPSSQTKVGQKKTWAKRRLLAAEQKVDEIHRLLAMAADLRATVVSVQQAIKKAEERVTSKLRKKSHEIAEHERQRATVLSEMAERVDRARTARMVKQHSTRASAAFEEMFAGSVPVSPIAKVPLNSESAEARPTISDASKSAQQLPQPLIKAIPATDRLAPVRSTEGKDLEPRVEATSSVRAANVSSRSGKAPEDPRLVSVQERIETPHHSTVKQAPRKERKALASGNNSVLAKGDALQPSSKAPTLTPEAKLKKPLASATQKFVSSSTDVTKGNTLSSDHSPVSGIRAQKDRTEIATKTEINGDDRSLSRSEHPGSASGKSLTKQDLAEMARKKLETSVGAKRKDNLDVNYARQAAVKRAQAIAEKEKAQIARPSGGLTPMEALGSKSSAVPTLGKTVVPPTRTLQTNSEPNRLNSGVVSDTGPLTRKPGAGPAAPSHNERDKKLIEERVPPEPVFSKGKVSSAIADWKSPKKGHER
ncbi:hypothetical protein QQS45_05530 [Alteriqipengyuania flavescens]|uniref:hypothetical protein n=1 Tax=Alteriqipengyuania flavescens TaxID=3053610 RepID=UPI0025B60555|nr:hypothetical protein [Alteriqipengyuania flavescens]WJY19678.1 hypothetical protein QQW98_05525 [Alteriqipengyuania flavescens]WJY25618.1 hypothetical protein QQS45_05530 [Alteriqipengyuania flavescens]